MSASPASFSAQHVIEYDYRRSVGPILGRFFTALRDRRLLGIRGSDGRVLVPPAEADPITGKALFEWVDVGPGGTVRSFTWIARPSEKAPLARPFAWALIQLDGADTALVHAVDAGSESEISTGMRVRPRWRAETEGSIHDIECFEPEAG